jgi:hypothetical protein
MMGQAAGAAQDQLFYSLNLDAYIGSDHLLRAASIASLTLGGYLD